MSRRGTLVAMWQAMNDNIPTLVIGWAMSATSTIKLVVIGASGVGKTSLRTQASISSP